MSNANAESEEIIDNSPVQVDMQPETDEHGFTINTAYSVSQNECMSSIASHAGYLWETLWDHPDNSSAKEKRKNPNCLLPNDKVRVPEVRIKQVDADTEQKHKFKLLIKPTILRLRLMAFDEPLANEPFELKIDDEVYTGTTDSDGMMEQEISPLATTGYLVVGEKPEQHEYDLKIGALDPVDTFSGFAARLNNLGFAAGPADATNAKEGWDNKVFRRAVRKFQRQYGIPPTGVVDDRTKDEMLRATGITKAIGA